MRHLCMGRDHCALANCISVLQKISDLRATLGGGSDQGIVSPAFETGTYVRPFLSPLTYAHTHHRAKLLPTHPRMRKPE